MFILDKFGVKIDSLAGGSGGKLATGFQTTIPGHLGDKVRNFKHYDSMLKRMEELADVPEKLTKDSVTKATNSANRQLARNVHFAKFAKAASTEFTALSNRIKMEAQLKQQMMQITDGVQQTVDVYGRAVDNSQYNQDVTEAGYKAYKDELSNGGTTNLSGW